MKRFLTLNFVLFTTFSIVLFSLGYSLHHIQVSFTRNILNNYSKNMRSDLIQMRLNLQTILNDSAQNSIEILPNMLTRFINIHPTIRRLQIYFGQRLIADSDITKIPLADRIKKKCPSLSHMRSESIQEGIYCYHIPLRVYRDGRRIDAKLYIFIDRDLLNREIARTLREMMAPVIGVMVVVLLVSAFLIWSTMIRNFSRLMHWSDDPTKRPPLFHIVEFAKLATKMHEFALKLTLQFEQLTKAMHRENDLRSIMNTVAKVNELLVTQKEEESFLRQAVQILSEHRNYFGTSIFLKENGRVFPAASIVNVDDDTSAQKGSLCIGFDELERLENPNEKYLIRRARNCATCNDNHLEILFPQTIDEAWIAIFPLRHDTTASPLGYLVINTLSSNGFDDEEIQMLSELAGDIGFAIRAFRQEKAFEASLYTHPLTHLPNAAAFNAHIGEYLGRIAAMANIDRFKQINTLYGVKVADEILKDFGKYFLSLIPEGSNLFHYMGDEFVLLFPANADKQESETILRELLEKLETHIFEYEGVEILLSVRFGVTIVENEGSLQECHLALKEAKKRQSPIQWYTPDLSQMVKTDMIKTYRLIKEALENGRVVTHYQGIYSLRKKVFSHYEALIRLEDEQGHLIMPGSFIEFAKQTRLYPELSLQVFKNALEAIETLGTSVSVNLSVIDLRNESFCQTIFEALEQKELSHPLIFEILESENIENYEQTIAFVRKVKAYGCRVSIDDFGSGYANFQHIARLDADILKIDGSLIQEIVHDTQILAIVRNISQIAEELGMITVAEFVSDDKILAAVQRLGIDMAQGFVLHKPMPLERILQSSIGGCDSSSDDA